MSISTSLEAFSLQLKPADRSIPELPDREQPRTLPKTEAEWRSLTGSVSPKTHPDPFGNEKDREIFGLSPPPKYPEGVSPRPMDVFVIGGGLSGTMISMLSRWRLQNANIRIFEKNPSFDEIFQYFKYIFHKYGVADHVEFSSNVVGNTWDEGKGKWIVEVERGAGANKTVTEEECDVLINAQGLLNRPKLPAIPGISTYRGQLVHSSQWDHKTCVVDGKRVGVIGNGSTGIQVAAAIGSKVDRLDHFCKTPTWVAPYGMNFAVSLEDRDRQLDPTAHIENYRNAWIRGEKTWVWWTRPNWHSDADRYQATLLNVAKKYLNA
ncbi:hypothetical protein HDU93_001064, partial [Gonapodya sp. JEL0774]